MTFEDDDDDEVAVPSGSRRSSFVPPAVETDEVPGLPPATDFDAKPGSTLADADDLHVREPEPVAALDEPSEAESEMILAEPEPIDIPHIVVTDPLPEALPGTGSILDDNRFFPQVVTGIDPMTEAELPFFEPTVDVDVTAPDDSELEPEPQPEPEPAPEIHAASATEIEPETSVVPDASEDAVNVELAETPADLPEIPVRVSLTADAISELISSQSSMSSNDIMAMLDDQIPLRETDILEITEYVSTLDEIVHPQRDARYVEAARMFGDLAPELFTHIVIEPESPVFDAETESHVDAYVEHEIAETNQKWSLPAPTDVVFGSAIGVERRGWWTVAAYGAIVSAALVAGYALLAAHSDTTPNVWAVLLGLLIPVALLEPARRFHVNRGRTWRAALEDVFGVVPGRIAAGGFAVLVLVAAVSVTINATAGVGPQIEQSDAGGQLVATLFTAGTVGPIVSALVLVAGAVIAALPHRWYRAKILVLVGLVLVASGSAAVMGATLISLSSDGSGTDINTVLTQVGIIAGMALIVIPASIDGFQSVSRVREVPAGTVWLYAGLGIGVAVIATVVSLSIVAQSNDDFFFAQNPLLLVETGSSTLNFLLGAAIALPALLLVSALAFRAIGSITHTDDRDDPLPSVRWALVAAPVAVGAVAYLGYVQAVIAVLPSVSTLAIPVAAVLGVLAARGTVNRPFRSASTQRVLSVVAGVAAIGGLGFAADNAVSASWVGFINSALQSAGGGLMHIDAVAPLATAALAYVVGIVVVLNATRSRL